MNSIGPLGLGGLVPLGFALLWAVRLVYGSGGSDDILRRFLTAAAWTMLIGGLLAISFAFVNVFVIPLGVVLVCVLLMIQNRYRESERRSLLWALALTARKGLPLSVVARGFAENRATDTGYRARVLARFLDEGSPLEIALAHARLSLPIDARIGLRMGSFTGDMAQTLQNMASVTDDLGSILRNLIERCFYLLVIVALGVSILTYVMLQIVPVFVEMFEEFALELPHSTLALISVSAFFVRYFFLFLPLLMLGLLPLLAGLLYYIGWLPTGFPVVSRLARRLDSSRLMWSLAIALRHDQTIHGTVCHLSDVYPRSGIRRRLRRAAQKIDQGTSWHVALVQVQLVRPVDAAVLRAAERAGNLPWALEEMADSTLRRFIYRLRAALDIAFPFVILGLGSAVFFVWLALFTPLIALISGLS